MSRGNGNGGPVGLEALEALFGGGQKRLTPEEARAQRKAAFEATLDSALNGCDGAKEDADHRLRDEALVGFLRGSFRMDTVPPQVADAILKVMAFEVTHTTTDGADMGKQMAEIFDKGMSRALLIAGAVLRVKDLPALPTQGGTGVYL